MGGGGTKSRRCRETSTPGQLANGHREYETKNGYKVRFDEAKGNVPSHWHVENPNSMSKKIGYYLNELGFPIDRHTASSALTQE